MGCIEAPRATRDALGGGILHRAVIQSVTLS